MDPNANLEELLELAMQLQEENENKSDEEFSADLDRLTSLIFALDGWMCGGGFLPKEWEEARNR